MSVLNIPVADDVHYARVWLVELDGDPAVFCQISERVIAALESTPVINIESDGVASPWQVEVVRYGDISPALTELLPHLTESMERVLYHVSDGFLLSLVVLAV